MRALLTMMMVSLFVLNGCGGSSSEGEGAASPSGGSSADDDPKGDKAPSDLAPLLEAQNDLRKQHCAPPLAWSDTVARAAKKWADHLAKQGCSLEHSSTDYGENLAGGTAGTLPPDEVARIWYREKEHYSFGKGGFSMHTGHFTQLVWVGTRRVGCAKASCGDRDVWVCNYDPPGNVEGEYKRNVLPTSCKK